MGCNELISYFTLLARAAFFLPIKLSISPREFSHSCSSDSLPHPAVGEVSEQLCRA